MSTFAYDDAAATLVLNYEKDMSVPLIMNSAISFQNLAETYYFRARNGLDYDKNMKNAAYAAAIARYIITRN